MGEKTVFKRIIDGEIPAKIVYQDELCLAFHDIAPQAPMHVIVIPRKEIPSLADAADADSALLGHLVVTTRKLADQLGQGRGDPGRPGGLELDADQLQLPEQGVVVGLEGQVARHRHGRALRVRDFRCGLPRGR